MEPTPVDVDSSTPARDCHVHELYLAPRHSDLDTFRCGTDREEQVCEKVDFRCVGSDCAQHCHGTGVFIPQCIDVSGRLNGINQCADQSDEDGFENHIVDVGDATTCPDDFGRNAHVSLLGLTPLPDDEINDCGGEHDPDVHFQCGNGKYVDKSALCNNFNNCGDNTDEDQCSGALRVSVSALSGRTISEETLSHHTQAFHDRQYSFDSLGSFEGKTFIKYSNDDKWIDRHHVMVKIRTNEPTTVHIVRAAGTAQWALDEGFTLDHSLTGVSFRGLRTINRAGPASEWEDTRHKEWNPLINTEEPIHLSEVLSKTFPAGTISIPGNDGHDGSFLIFVDRPPAHDTQPPMTGLWRDLSGDFYGGAVIQLGLVCTVQNPSNILWQTAAYTCQEHDGQWDFVEQRAAGGIHSHRMEMQSDGRLRVTKGSSHTWFLSRLASQD